MDVDLDFVMFFRSYCRFVSLSDKVTRRPRRGPKVAAFRRREKKKPPIYRGNTETLFVFAVVVARCDRAS